MTVVEREGQPVAVLVHDPAVLDDPGLLEAVASAAQLAASNARLQAEVQARVVELEASRRRILAARDDERRRLEHRLHEGAERRLGELAETLRRSRRSAPGDADQGPDRPRRGPARANAGGAAPAGPRAASARAVRAWAGRAPWRRWRRTSRFRSRSRSQVTRCPQRVAVVAYFVCAEALANVAKHAAAARVAVSVTARDGRVRVEIEDDGVGGADPGRGIRPAGARRPGRDRRRDAPGGRAFPGRGHASPPRSPSAARRRSDQAASVDLRPWVRRPDELVARVHRLHPMQGLAKLAQRVAVRRLPRCWWRGRQPRPLRRGPAPSRDHHAAGSSTPGPHSGCWSSCSSAVNGTAVIADGPSRGACSITTRQAARPPPPGPRTSPTTPTPPGSCSSGGSGRGEIDTCTLNSPAASFDNTGTTPIASTVSRTAAGDGVSANHG